MDSQSPKLVVVDLPSAGGEEGFAKQGGGRVLCGEMKNSACVCVCVRGEAVLSDNLPTISETSCCVGSFITHKYIHPPNHVFSNGHNAEECCVCVNLQ